MTPNLRGFAVIVVAMASVPRLAAARALPRALSADDWCGEEGQSRRERYCEVREAVLPPGPGAIRVDAGANGGISVQGTRRDERSLRVKIVAVADSAEEARALVAGVRIETSPTVHAEGPSSSGNGSWSVHFELTVPQRSDLSLTARNGGIVIDQVDGAIEFETTNGGVTLSGLAGKVDGRTTNGGVRLRLQGTEWQGEGLNVQTTNGSVSLRVPEGYNARLVTGTVHGAVRIDSGLTVHGQLEQKNGALRRIAADLGAGGHPIQVTTTNGGVIVEQR